MTIKTILIILAYFLLFSGAFIVVALIRKRLRKQRPPLEFKYIRNAGDSIREKIEKKNDALIYIFILALFVPFCSWFIPISAFTIFYPEVTPTVWISACAVTTLAGFALAFRTLINSFQEIANLELGLNGEQIVANELKPLEREGWSVFHDVPASGNGKEFNLDHVAIGPTGIALIETKTRSKAKAIRDREDHVVTFDGRKLVWPWGESSSELQQLKRQREWLEKWIHERTGKRLEILPVLVIPGWWIECRSPKARTRVVNHKNLCSAIKGKGEIALDAETIDLLTRQLNTICLAKTNTP